LIRTEGGNEVEVKSEGEKGESSASIVFFVFSPPIDNSDPDEGKLTDDRVVNLAPILDHL